MLEEAGAVDHLLVGLHLVEVVLELPEHLGIMELPTQAAAAAAFLEMPQEQTAAPVL